MNNSLPESKYWAIVPAAGVGQRMQANCPKQYLEIDGITILQRTLERLLSHPNIQGAVVSLSPNDEYWQDIVLQSDKPVKVVDGGSERCYSVLNALDYLVQSQGDVWALVHDAARPCVRHEDITQLIEQASDAQGGILALPVRDTMKRQLSNTHDIATTVDRSGLWNALTPQMFAAKSLLTALKHALDNGDEVTDDASAMELAGINPHLIEAHEDNIKITRPADLALATLYLQAQNNTR